MRRETVEVPAQVTASGRLVSPFAEGLASIDLDDIARTLSNLPFGLGHTPRFVSQAQFAALVARAGPPSDGRYALLWQAPACYLGLLPDALAPTRHRMPDGGWVDRDLAYFVVLEQILRHFGLPATSPPLLTRIAEAADRAAATITRDVGPRPPAGRALVRPLGDPLPGRLEPLSPDRACRAWLDAWRAYRPDSPHADDAVLRN